ncbi:hypothetical protein THAOC_29648, partial [Thalassiosira oceanica]
MYIKACRTLFSANIESFSGSGLPTFSSSHTACRQAGAFGPIAGSPFTLRMCLAEDMGSPLRFGRPPGTLDPGVMGVPRTARSSGFLTNRGALHLLPT